MRFTDATTVRFLLNVCDLAENIDDVNFDSSGKKSLFQAVMKKMHFKKDSKKHFFWARKVMANPEVKEFVRKEIKAKLERQEALKEKQVLQEPPR